MTTTETYSDSTADALKGLKGKEHVKYVSEKYSKAKSDRLQFEQTWYTNLAFYFGKQYVQWSKVGGQNSIPGYANLYEPPAPPWRVRLVSNQIKPIIRAELAKVTKEKPQGFVMPKTTDDDDIAAARAAEKIIEHLQWELKFDRELRRTLFWTLTCGAGFMKDWFDPSKPDRSGVQGAISIERVTPFHLFIPDPQEEELDNQPFIIHSIGKHPEWVKSRYDVKVNAESAAGNGVLDQKFMKAIGLKNTPKSHVVVNEMWVRPCSKYKDGAVIITAGDKLLKFYEGWPYAHNEYPFTKFDHVPTGRFYSESVIPDLIPLQKEYNRTRSQIIESKNRMSKPQLMAPRGSIDANKVTSEPGLIVFYQPGFNPPQPIPLQQIPQYVLEELDRCRRDMDDISAQHEVTKGRTPPGVTAATAISYLQEEDDSKLAPTIASIEEGVERVGRHMLSHVQEFWDAERQIRVLGDDGQFEQYSFSKADIANNTDFVVQAGSATPRSRAAKQAFIMELGKMGWIPPDRVMRYLDMAETGRLHEEMLIDTRQAQRENMRMMQGQEVPVNEWDNHEVHILEHNNFRKRQQFENLDEQAKQIFHLHVQKHEEVLAQEMPPEGMEDPGAEGGEGGGPTPSPGPSGPQGVAGDGPPPVETGIPGAGG